MFYCMFEQSGTFKNQFKKLGYEAIDLDIQNEFGETDRVIDLFSEIENAYGGAKSVFDEITEEDMILAFFPCIRFENQIYMHFQGKAKQYKNWSDEEKLEMNMRLHHELNELYCLISRMVIVCLRRNIRLIIENPYSSEHYLTRYWSLQPKIIDKDRTTRGDYFNKPTQYWFVNCEPKHNFIFEPLRIVEHKVIIGRNSDGHHCTTVERSMIHPQYANRFIREFILEGK